MKKKAVNLKHAVSFSTVLDFSIMTIIISNKNIYKVNVDVGISGKKEMKQGRDEIKQGRI